MYVSKNYHAPHQEPGSPLFMLLPGSLFTTQTQFWQLYVVVCQSVKAGNLYIQPAYSSDFLSSRDFLLTFC